MKKYVLAIDQGTTSSRAVLFDRAGRIVGVSQKELTQYYPRPGWVEHDAWQIWTDVRECIFDVARKEGVSLSDIAAIGITNQRETTVVWDKRTGRPVAPAVVWQCRRTADRAAALKESGWGKKIYEKTGLLPDAYFSATKLEWILQNTEGARESAEAGELLFGTIDCWLLYCLTGGKVHATDYTNAARTMLFNIHTLRWDSELLSLFDIPVSMLPSVRDCAGFFGTAEALGADIPVTGIAGDQQASLFGQGCFAEGDVKNTYGTGCFLLLNTGEKAVSTDSGLLTTIAMAKDGRARYALEGSVFIGGAVVQWLRDEMRLIRKASETEARALAVPDNGGVYVVPAFVGLGAPYWDTYARGAVLGLTRGSNADHIIRASLEAIAYQVEDLLSTMRTATGISPERLLVDGGACANDFLMQFQADISQTEICRPAVIETTVRGAAFLAGLAVGVWKDENELKTLITPDRTFRGEMAETRRAELLAGWKKAVSRAAGWEN